MCVMMKKYSLILSVSILALTPYHNVFAQSENDANAAELFIEEFLEQSEPVVDLPQASDSSGDIDVVIETNVEPSVTPEPVVELTPVPAREDNIEVAEPAPENNVQIVEAAPVPQDNVQVVEATPEPQDPVTIVDQGAVLVEPPQEQLSVVEPIVTGGASINVPPPSQGNFAIPDAGRSVQAPNIDEGLFFDSEAVVPQGEQAAVGIRNVSPRTSPASKYVFVSKKRSANSRQAKVVSAQRALKLGRYESALDLYNDLYAKNRRNQDVLMGRAVSLQKMGRDDAAVEAYEELLGVNPNHVEASINMVGIIGQRYPAVASRRLQELKKKNPNNVAILSQLAVIEGNVGRYDQALRYLGVASGLQPKNAGHLYNMAVISDRAGNQKLAVEYYEQALEIDAVHGSSRSVPREAIFARLSQIR